jgi:hypothetical protein
MFNDTLKTAFDNLKSKAVLSSTQPPYFEYDIDTSKFILNGNSSLSAILLPNTTVQTTLYTKRVTNQFGANLNSFSMMEEIFNKPDFFKKYGNIFLLVFIKWL